LEVHKGKSVLKIDKYLSCAVPSPELEFVLESKGIQNYEAYLDPEFNFKHGICDNEGVISEIFSPDIKGDHYNPYIRFKSCISSASRSCSLLMDLVGLEVKDLDFGHDNIFLDIVCTFPGIVDYYLINPACRSKALHKIYKNGLVHPSRLDIKSLNFIDRMNRCRKLFFDKLHEFSSVPDGNRLGMSSSLHVWSSEVPLLPNCHVHNIIPFFSYKSKCVRDPNFFSDFKSDFPEYLELVFAEVDNTSRNCNKRFESDSTDSKFNKGKTRIVYSDNKIVQRFIVDRDNYKELRLELSNLLKEVVGFRQCSWFDSNCPIDIDKLKELWSDIVYNEFYDIMDHYELLDIHVSWIPWYKKAKLRSALQYKVRPPVLDLDLFFKKCPGVVVDYTKLNLDKVLDYLDYQLQIAIKCSDYDKINRYESMLNKAESIFGNYSESDIYSWLQFLSTWVTDTRVYGIWKNLCRYLLDPDHELLVVEELCPICNGVYSDTSIKVKSCIVDYVLVQERSKYLVYNVKNGPPDEPEGPGDPPSPEWGDLL
jgi:hypothetical protein